MSTLPEAQVMSALPQALVVTPAVGTVLSIAPEPVSASVSSVPQQPVSIRTLPNGDLVRDQPLVWTPYWILAFGAGMFVLMAIVVTTSVPSGGAVSALFWISLVLVVVVGLLQLRRPESKGHRIVLSAVKLHIEEFGPESTLCGSPACFDVAITDVAAVAVLLHYGSDRHQHHSHVTASIIFRTRAGTNHYGTVFKNDFWGDAAADIDATSEANFWVAALNARGAQAQYQPPVPHFVGFFGR